MRSVRFEPASRLISRKNRSCNGLARISKPYPIAPWPFTRPDHALYLITLLCKTKNPGHFRRCDLSTRYLHEWNRFWAQLQTISATVTCLISASVIPEDKATTLDHVTRAVVSWHVVIIFSRRTSRLDCRFSWRVFASSLSRPRGRGGALLPAAPPTRYEDTARSHVDTAFVRFAGLPLKQIRQGLCSSSGCAWNHGHRRRTMYSGQDRVVVLVNRKQQN